MVRDDGFDVALAVVTQFKSVPVVDFWSGFDIGKC